MKLVLFNALVSLFVVAFGIAAYHHYVRSPADRIGVIDVTEVYRLKEKQFTDLMDKARTALQARKLDEAAQAIAAALQLKPTDAGARALQGQVAKARTDGPAMDRQEKVKQLVLQARTAIAAKKLDDADKFLDQAEALAPRDAAVAQARADLTKAQREMAWVSRRSWPAMGTWPATARSTSPSWRPRPGTRCGWPICSARCLAWTCRRSSRNEPCLQSGPIPSKRIGSGCLVVDPRPGLGSLFPAHRRWPCRRRSGAT